MEKSAINVHYQSVKHSLKKNYPYFSTTLYNFGRFKSHLYLHYYIMKIDIIQTILE